MLIIFIISSLIGCLSKIKNYNDYDYIDVFKIGDIVYTFKYSITKKTFDKLKKQFANGRKIEDCTMYDLPTHVINNHTMEVSKIKY